MSGLVVATLTCSRCGEEAPHDLRYAGRIVASTRCHNCGYTMRHDVGDLRAAYADDLKQRLTTKPIRMFRRMSRHPIGYTLHIPGSLLAKPKRLLDEVLPLLGGDDSEEEHTSGPGRDVPG